MPRRYGCAGQKICPKMKNPANMKCRPCTTANVERNVKHSESPRKRGELAERKRVPRSQQTTAFQRNKIHSGKSATMPRRFRICRRKTIEASLSSIPITCTFKHVRKRASRMGFECRIIYRCCVCIMTQLCPRTYTV